MVFVIVEVEQQDVGDIVTRLIGTKHKITFVEELETACGCGKRNSKESSLVQAEPASDIFQRPEMTEIKLEDQLFQNYLDSVNNTPSPSIRNENKSVPSTSKRRNNGVTYNSNCIAAEKDDIFPEGVDLAIKCMLCTKTVALGNRLANHSTRKYAHARSHGFNNRFGCSLCAAVFRNKRVVMNHNKNSHDNAPTFKVIDTWNEENQRELKQMVKQCFPKDNKPFLREMDDPIEDDCDDFSCE